MGTKQITPDVYDKLVQAYRQEINHARAGQITGLHESTAHRAFHEGWPRKQLLPIKQVLLDEQLAARAELERLHKERLAKREKEQEEARENAIKSRTIEGQMIALAKGASLRALGVNQSLLTGALGLAQQVQKQLAAETAKPDVDKLAPKESLYLLRQAAIVAKDVIAAAQATMQMERLHLGQPTDIINVTGGAHPADNPDMSMEDAQLRIEAAQQAMDSARRRLGMRQHLQVIPGGQGSTELPGEPMPGAAAANGNDGAGE